MQCSELAARWRTRARKEPVVKDLGLLYTLRLGGNCDGQPRKGLRFRIDQLTDQSSVTIWNIEIYKLYKGKSEQVSHIPSSLQPRFFSSTASGSCFLPSVIQCLLFVVPCLRPLLGPRSLRGPHLIRPRFLQQPTAGQQQGQAMVTGVHLVQTLQLEGF